MRGDMFGPAAYIRDLNESHDNGYQLGLRHGLERAAEATMRVVKMVTDDISSVDEMRHLLQTLPDEFLAIVNDVEEKRRSRR